MDLVRYAETHGSESDPEIPGAWRYRDYLIRAFNADVPCDQLIREQIAGDLLPQPRWNTAEGINESILGIAQLRFVEHGFQPIDALDDQVKVVENQIDVLGKAFQGLTLACARCHDHKFDAISQRDFYALFGVFASCRPTQVTVDVPDRLRVHREELIALKKMIKAELAGRWMWNAARFGEYLRAQIDRHGTNDLKRPENELDERIQSLEQKRRSLRRAVVERVLHRGSGLPMPVAAWTFDADTRDVVGNMHGQLHGGASLKNGRLILNGQGAFVQTGPLESAVREKTLEVWLTLANRDQRGGGVISLEALDGSVFDAVVFAEQEPEKWMAGSDFFRRTRAAGGSAETTSSEEMIHLAIAYRTDNSISLYRNGVAYGPAYTPAGDGHAKLQSYAAGKSHVLFGLRHTGAGNGFLAGEIEAGFLYDRALSAGEIGQLFKAGPPRGAADELVTIEKDRTEEAELIRQLEQVRAQLKARFPHYAEDRAMQQRWSAALYGPVDIGQPLYAWKKLRNGDQFPVEWASVAREIRKEADNRSEFNREKFKAGWDRTGIERDWFRTGVNRPEAIAEAGEFSVEPEGERVIGRIYPAGVYSHLLSQKHNGLLTSPRFRVTSDNISVRALGGKGARLRLIVENYPIGAEGIYPQAELKSEGLQWVRLDTAYRRGSYAYLEFATAEEVLSRTRTPAGPGGRSYFGAERVAFHDEKATPKDEPLASPLLLQGPAPTSIEELASCYTCSLTNAILAWRFGGFGDREQAFLDYFVGENLLSNSTNDSPRLAALVSQYRQLELEIPVPRRAPGVLETVAYNAPLLSRGDHTKPGEPVPRRYLEVFSSEPYRTSRSGRLELANEIASPANPLTARVMINRIWQHLFGRGLVASVDNFGRLGELPANPELLDYLAARFVEHGWSFKEMIRFLVTSRAYQMSNDSSERARELDPGNELLSHMPVRRQEAEAIRDNLLSVSGRLDETMFGPGLNALAPPVEQTRRSIYLGVRRTSLSPFLQAFDAPKPFTTLGRREATNVPGQSLALLNDPFVIELSTRWARLLIQKGEDSDQRVRDMFDRALGRLPTEAELSASRAYLGELSGERSGNLANDEQVWRDFAQSLFNLKEFIYVR